MTNINLAQALDLSDMATRIKKEVQEEAEIKAKLFKERLSLKLTEQNA